MKIENSLESKNLSKIQKIFTITEKYFVTWHLRQQSTGCSIWFRNRLHLVNLESLIKRTKLYQVYWDVLPQMWQRICEQRAILPSMYCSVFRKIPWYFYKFEDSKVKVTWVWVKKEKWSPFRKRSSEKKITEKDNCTHKHGLIHLLMIQNEPFNSHE